MPVVITLNHQYFELSEQPTDKEIGAMLRLFSGADRLDPNYLTGDYRYTKRKPGQQSRVEVQVEHVDLEQIADYEPEPEAVTTLKPCRGCGKDTAPGLSCGACGAPSPHGLFSDADCSAASPVTAGGGDHA